MSDLEHVIQSFKLSKAGGDIPAEYDPELWLKVYDTEEDNDIRLENNVMFSHETIRESLFWLKRLVLERYYAKQKRLLLTDIRNHNKPNLDTVIWWNHLNDNYTKGLKILKWNNWPDNWPDLDDDEISYVNVNWNRIFSDKPYPSDFNNIEPKNSWLERKTKKK